MSTSDALCLEEAPPWISEPITRNLYHYQQLQDLPLCCLHCLWQAENLLPVNAFPTNHRQNLLEKFISPACTGYTAKIGFPLLTLSRVRTFECTQRNNFLPPLICISHNIITFHYTTVLPSFRCIYPRKSQNSLEVVELDSASANHLVKIWLFRPRLRDTTACTEPLLSASSTMHPFLQV